MDQQLKRLRELAERHADRRAAETAIPRVNINVALEPTSIRPSLYPTQQRRSVTLDVNRIWQKKICTIPLKKGINSQKCSGFEHKALLF